MFKFLLYSVILYIVYSYFVRLGRIERRDRDDHTRSVNDKKRKQTKKYPDEEYVDYEEIK